MKTNSIYDLQKVYDCCIIIYKLTRGHSCRDYVLWEKCRKAGASEEHYKMALKQLIEHNELRTCGVCSWQHTGPVGGHQ